CKSQSACSRIQNCGDVFNKRASLRAVSALMLRLPSTISFSRLREIPSRRAASACPTPIGLRNSSSKISPGVIAGPSQSGCLVIVFNADLVGMSLLPPEGQAVLVIDSHAVAPRVIPCQPLETVASGNRKVCEPCGHVKCLQLPLSSAP